MLPDVPSRVGGAAGYETTGGRDGWSLVWWPTLSDLDGASPLDGTADYGLYLLPNYNALVRETGCTWL